jgi:aminoglycoside phosphotransferase (APT) family kinase protein
VDVAEILGSDFPELGVDGVERIGEGWDHVAYLVNGEYVFRLPTGDDVLHVLPEVELLRAVTGRLPIETPDPVFVPDHGRYFGYRFLAGRSVEDLMDDDTFTLDSRFLDLLVEVIVGIEMAVSAEDAAVFGLPRFDELLRYPAQERRALSSDLLTARAKSVAAGVAGRVDRLWRDAIPRGFTAMHADLGLDHWIVDDGGRVYALIDWSDSCIAPPELQLSTTMWHLREQVTEVVARYTAATGRHVDRDLVFACGYLNALSDLGELLDDDEADEDDIEWCVSFLNDWS